MIDLLVILAWFRINPRDRFSWYLEVAPAIAGAVILVAVYPRFKFTAQVYSFIFLRARILSAGGHYTYAEAPPFNWLRDTFDWSRNYYDRVGHFFQGFVLA